MVVPGQHGVSDRDADEILDAFNQGDVNMQYTSSIQFADAQSGRISMPDYYSSRG